MHRRSLNERCLSESGELGDTPVDVVSSVETLLSGANWNLSRFARNSKPFLADCQTSMRPADYAER